MKHVIHADNSEFFRKQMKTWLSETGLEHESFASGQEAVDAVADGRAAFVITGMELCDMGGEELIKRLMVLPQKPPVLVVTSNEDPQQHERLYALGVKAIILKSGEWKAELSKVIC